MTRRATLGWLLGGLLLAASTAMGVEEDEPLQVAAAAPSATEGQTPGTISLHVKDAEIRTVLEALGRKAGMNVVTTNDVAGVVTLHLDNVPWEQALDTIAKTSGFGYERDGTVYTVTGLDALKTRREKVRELVQIEPVTTRVIQLKYLDAADVKAFLEPQLTASGKISVLEMTGQKGWEFGTGTAGSSSAEEGRERQDREKARSKAIVITDTPSTIDRFEKVLSQIDVMPKQILIETRVMEVSRDVLRDINPAMVTGATAGSSTLTMRNMPAAKQAGVSIAEFAASQVSGSFTPSAFVPLTTGLSPSAAGAQLFFQRLIGTQVSALVQLLEEDVRTNTLSAPHILTLSGQEARIMVGTKYPILETQVSGTDTTTTTTTLSYYQDIGIELFVVPQVAGDRHIDMIIHPVISARTSTLGTNAYPILDVREAETQVVMADGDTIVIGGLLKDVKTKSNIGWPFLGKIPVLGLLFTRSTTDLTKIDLLIFITARIVASGAMTPEQLQDLQRRLERPPTKSPRRSRAPRRREEPPPSEPPPAETTSSPTNRGFLSGHP
ncbi:MAG: secretin and TonB N-terminal domain-containing protein [Candidatus Omnitrophica bacterium]|nr:secretin and TonB N-terminal domain-containing protein [Candidatus Omnitrophota bacterium]